LASEALGWLQIAIGVAGVVAFVVIANAQQQSAATLLRTGMWVPGVVTDYSGVSQDANGYIDVNYPVAGRWHSGVIYLTPGSATYHFGETVTVIYNPQNPSQIRTPQDANESGDSNNPVAAWPIAVLIGGIFFLVRGWIVVRRARRGHVSG
jgi:hypothetical protein